MRYIDITKRSATLLILLLTTILCATSQTGIDPSGQDIPAPIKIDTNYCWGRTAVKIIIMNDISLHECDSMDKVQEIERDTLNARIKVKEQKIVNLEQQIANAMLIQTEKDVQIGSLKVEKGILQSEYSKQKKQKVVWIIVSSVLGGAFATFVTYIATK